MAKPLTIAIDGPSAVGKNAVGCLLAKRLGYRFFDTGAMYRAITWLALRRGIDLGDEVTLSQLAEKARVLLGQPIKGAARRNSVFVDRQNVTNEVRRPAVEANVSAVSKIAGVRRALVTQQREMARNGRVVMVGRDIGTVVLPQADLKIFLTGSPEERAQRRYLELREGGQSPNYEAILADINRRDTIDSQRAISPLTPAPDARIVNTNGLVIEEVLAIIMDMIEKC